MEPVEYDDDDCATTTVRLEDDYFDDKKSRILESSITMNVLSLDKVLQKAGGFGRFQIYMSVVFSLSFISGSILAYSSTYLIQDPAYLCIKTPGSDYESCTKDEACEIGSWKIDWYDPNSLDNWINEFNLNCAPPKKTSLLSSMYYCGYAFGCLFIPRITDKIGRRFPLMLCMIFQFPLYMALLFSKTVELNTALCFFLGVTCVGRYNGCFINISEFVHTNYKNHVSTLLLIQDSITTIFVAAYYEFSKNWLYLQIFGVAISGLSIIGLWFIPETPEYLYSYHKFSQCKYICNYIAWFNGRELSQTYSFDLEHQLKEINFSIITAGSDYQKSREIDYELSRSTKIKNSLKTGIREFMKDKVLVKNLVVNVLLWMVTICTYNIITIHSNYFPGDQYKSDIVGACVELPAYILGEVIYEKVTGKKLFFFSYMFAAIAGSLMLTNQGNIEMIASYSARFGISITYSGIYLSNEVFPVLYSSTTFGVCNFFAGITGLITYETILKLEDQVQICIMIILCMAGGVIAIFLKE
ncbi:solute carrier family member 5 [Stylonychia lemnae]|uniref:Solute carrier family member 5 n=1 Tax=Stylonychia lemnae TaxID=5949 RepID=A0A078AW60_STYLE|nr:solute carrier family member 5 [Stylonychia lemnae]|eukprot:CDW86321.1 solute carrier family member 5 [Stylonychia lemnae]